MQRRLFSRILTQAAQKRQSDLALWISEGNFKSLISFSELRVKLLGYIHTHSHTHSHIIAWLNSSPSHNGRQHKLICLSDICSVTPATWWRLLSVSWPERTGQKLSVSSFPFSAHVCSAQSGSTFFLLRMRLPTTLASASGGTRWDPGTFVLHGRRPLTVIERMSHVGLMKPVTVSCTFALT